MEQGEKQAKDQAYHFYRQRRGDWNLLCVLTDEERPDWHHLDEKKPKWWHFLNIIPIARSLNDQLDKRESWGLPLDLQPDILRAKARDHYMNARYPQGYACARLGSFLMMPSRKDSAAGYGLDPDKSLEFSAYALINLRPISAIPFAIDTLRRNVLPILKDPANRIRIESRTKAMLAIELGPYFRDNGIADQAIVCCQLAEYYLRNLQTVTDEKLRARVVQHEAFSYAALGDFVSASEWLDRAREEFEDSSVYPEGPGNDILYRVRLILQQPNPDLDQCKELIQNVYKIEKKKALVSRWTIAEVYWTDSEHNLSRGRRKRAFEVVRRGNELFSEVGIVPTAVLAPTAVQEYREKYPSEMYVLPRQPKAVAEFVPFASKAIEYLSEYKGGT